VVSGAVVVVTSAVDSDEAGNVVAVAPVVPVVVGAGAVVVAAEVLTDEDEEWDNRQPTTAPPATTTRINGMTQRATAARRLDLLRLCWPGMTTTLTQAGRFRVDRSPSVVGRGVPGPTFYLTITPLKPITRSFSGSVQLAHR